MRRQPKIRGTRTVTSAARPAVSLSSFGPRRTAWSSDEQLDPLPDGLPADGAGLERGAAVDAGGVSALEDQLDVVVDADGAGDALLHLSVAGLQLLQQVVLLGILCARAAVHLGLVLSYFLGYGDLAFDAFLHAVCTFFTGHAVLAGAEQNQQSELRTDEAFTGTRRCGKNQVGHGVGCRVDPPQARTAQALTASDGLQALQPVLLRKVLDELQHGAVCHQIQRTLALVVGVADISSFLRQKTGDSHGDVQLGVSQETRRVQPAVERRGRTSLAALLCAAAPENRR